MRSVWREDFLTSKDPMRFFLFVSRPHWRSATIAIFCVVAAATLQASIPYLYKVITEGVMLLTTGTYGPVIWGISAYIAISLASHFLWRGSGFAGSFWATGARATARDTLYGYLSRHSYQYFSNRFAGSLLSKIKQAADGARDTISSFLWDILSFVVTLVVSFGIVFATSPLAAGILFALFVLLVPLNYFLAKKRVVLSSAAQNAETVLNGATVDSISNIFSVHEYAKRGFETERLRTLTLRRRTLGLKNWHYGEWMLTINGLFVYLFMGVLLLLSVYLVTTGALEAGDVVLFLATVWLLEHHFIHLSQQFQQVSETWGQITESLNDIIVPHGVLELPAASALAISESSLEFDRVSFDYEGTHVFRNLSFSIRAGERVGVIGRSGAGKSTLAKLILRHYDISGGRILVDGTDIATVTKESLRSSIAVVPQEPALFHRTIRENIAYARPDATEAEVHRAATLAQAHDFILKLPDGYESLVGERGVKLSGGQRQRIAIARALLKAAPILLLDEATSALDSESEVLVQKALLNLMEGRTVIAIAHRLSTLRAMDRLVIFDKGEIVEDGTHEELLLKGGLYADLWNHQAGGFLTDD